MIAQSFPLTEAPPPSSALLHELQSLDQLDVLEPGEIFVELEVAWSGADGERVQKEYGALIVTDLRVIFLATSMFRRKLKQLIRVPLEDVVVAETAIRQSALHRRPTVVLRARSNDRLDTLTFPLDTRATEERAAEIVTSIQSQQRLLVYRPRRWVGPSVEEAAEVAQGPPEVGVRVGRGVAEDVWLHGGRLYVWKTPVGEAFDAVRAGFDAPPEREFRRSSMVSDFELFIESGIWSARGLHLARRWWGLRPGITVDTGLVLDGGP